MSEVGVAREALARTVEENALAISRAGVGMVTARTLGQIAALIRKDTERDDADARRLIELMPVVDRTPLLAEGVLMEWFDLMLQAEAMDRALGELAVGLAPVIDVVADGRPMTVDGATRGRRG